jgi:hypothetical protein
MAVDGDVIGMTIATGFIEGDDDLGTKFANDGYQFANYIGGPGLSKGTWVLILGRTGHTRITISEKPEVI